MSPAVETHAELTALRARVEQLEARERRRGRWFLGLVAATLVLSPIALAADGNCPSGGNGLPFCFQPNQPALAANVNHNFAQLKEWLELKVGVTGGNVTIATPTTINNTLNVAGAAANGGNVTASGTVTARSLSVGTNSTLSGNLAVSGSTALNATSTGGLTVGGDLVANNNTTGACQDLPPACNMTACPTGWFMIGLDILENEACGGGGDFDFSQFVIRCCQL